MACPGSMAAGTDTGWTGDVQSQLSLDVPNSYGLLSLVTGVFTWGAVSRSEVKYKSGFRQQTSDSCL